MLLVHPVDRPHDEQLVHHRIVPSAWVPVLPVVKATNGVAPKGVIPMAILQRRGPPGPYIEDSLARTLVKHPLNNLVEQTSELEH